MTGDIDVGSAADHADEGVGDGTELHAARVLHRGDFAAEIAKLFAIMGDDRLVAAAGVGDVDGVRGHFGELVHVIDVVGETDGKGRDDLLAFS